MASLPGGGFEVALSNGYVFPNAAVDDFLIHSTGSTQRLLFGRPGSNATLVVSGSNIVVQGSLSVLGSISSTDSSSLLIDSTNSTSTSNAPTAAALKTTYDFVVSLSNSVGSSTGVIFSSNTAVAASNKAVSASNQANTACNIAIAASNTAYTACNLVIALSNSVSSQAAVIFSSNASAFSSNLATNTSNQLFPISVSASNLARNNSNQLYPMCMFSSNTVVWTSNFAKQTSNDMYPLSAFASNTAITACNIANWTSNNALLKHIGGTIQSNLTVNGVFYNNNNSNQVHLNTDGTTWANIELAGTDGTYIDMKNSATSYEDYDMRIQYVASDRLEFLSTSNYKFAFTGGNVGVGTTSPLLPLHIYTNDTSNSQFILHNGNASGRAGFTLRSSNYSYNIKESTNGLMIFEQTTNTTQPVVFYNYGDFSIRDRANANAERFKVQPTGNVGISANAPGSRLAVGGNATIGSPFSNVVAPSDGLIIYGQTGVGTSNPQRQLTVGSNQTVSIHPAAGGPRLEFGDSANSAAHMDIGAYNSVNNITSYAGRDLVITSNEVERFRFTSSGRLGVNTNNPGTTLAIAGNVAIGSAFSNQTGPTNGLAVAGNVGIGTNNPEAQLHVAGTVLLSSNIQIKTTNGNFDWFQFKSADTYGANIGIGAGGNTIIGGGEGALAILSNEAASTTEVLVLATDATSSNQGIRFVTSLNTGYPSRLEAATILGDGKFGINNTAPKSHLDVNGNVNVSSNLSSSNMFVNRMNFQGITVKKATTLPGDQSYGVYPFLFPGVSNETNTNTLNIYSFSNAIRFTTSSNEVVRFMGSNVGIGTSNPSANLHVVGSAMIGPAFRTNASSSNTAGGPFFKQQGWDVASASHSVVYSEFGVGDNCTGTLYIHASNKLANVNTSKVATAIITFVKRYGAAIYIFVVGSQRSDTMSTFNITTDVDNLQVSTDSDCSISWTSIGAF